MNDITAAVREVLRVRDAEREDEASTEDLLDAIAGLDDFETSLYPTVIREAAGLVSEDGENPEYDRGVYELIARLFPVLDLPTDDRVLDIEMDVVTAREVTA